MSKLTRQQDAFGRALCDTYLGGARGAVIERSDGAVEPFAPLASYFAPLRSWPARQRKALRLARGKVLDVGCGGGRVALHLQRKGLEVVGIDVSPGAVNVCRMQGLKKARLLSAAQVTPALGVFDTVVMYGNNFGVLGNPPAMRRFLKRLHRATTPRARILAETLDVYQTRDPLHLAYHRQNRRRGRMAGQIRIRVRYRAAATPWFDVLMVSVEELKALLAGTGWQVVRLFDPEGPAYVAVIEKETPPDARRKG
jgi:SAM-dependent methyltransferase